MGGLWFFLLFFLGFCYLIWSPVLTSFHRMIEEAAYSNLSHVFRPYDLVPIAMSILDVRDLIDVAVARTPEMIFRQPMVLLMFSSCYAVVLICSILQTRR